LKQLSFFLKHHDDRFNGSVSRGARKFLYPQLKLCIDVPVQQ